MQEVAISVFKAKCLALLEQVRVTRQPLRATRYGKPVAEVIPPSQAGERGDWLGSLADTAGMAGEVLPPVVEESDMVMP